MSLLQIRSFAGGIARLAVVIAALVGCEIVAAPASAQSPRPARPVVHALTAADLESFLDGVVPAQLERLKIPGAVIAIVHDGQLLLAKGYGYADVENKRPMTADTLVRPGSISKLFTAIAVMQLVDEGKLDLDRDVNGYIDFAVPAPAGGVPVTLRRLMTHRAGFEEHAKNLFTRDHTPEPLGHWLTRSLPLRLFPHGDVPAYSNYGMALAGYVVERTAGRPYASHVEDRILGPLGMRHSTFRQPLPDALAPLMAKGYMLSGRPPLDFFETIPAVPAGALSATAADMGRFMLALLGHGELDGTRIISSETLARMMAPQFATGSGFVGLTFYGTDVRGLRVIGHEGGTIAFVSGMMLSIEHGFGMFVSYNGRAGEAGPNLLLRVIGRYFPVGATAGRPSLDHADLAPLTGSYQPSRRGESSMLRVSALAAQLRVRGGGDATITVGSAAWPFKAAMRWAEIGPLLFRARNGRALAFENDNTFTIGPPLWEWQRVPWHADARIIVPAVAVSLLVAVTTLLAWPVAAIVRRRRGSSTPAPVRRARVAVHLALALDLIVALWTTAVFTAPALDPTILGDRLDPVLVVLYAMAWAAVLASAFAIWRVSQMWRTGAGRAWMRVHHTFQMLAAAVLAWFFVAYHIAGTTLNY